MLTTNEIEIFIPSDFKIKITSVKDCEGTPLSLDEVYLQFLFTDEVGNRYVAIHDPSGSCSVNTKYANGVLYVIFQKYRLSPGTVYCRLGNKLSDTDFSDGYWNWMGDIFKTGITLKSC